jgi:membrane associated rhomboid family serine protease
MTETTCLKCGRALEVENVGTLCEDCIADHLVRNSGDPQASGTVAGRSAGESGEPDEVAEGVPARDAEERSPERRIFRPWATYGLIALNVLVYVLMTATGASAMKPTPFQLLRWGADFGPLTLAGQPWRMLSSAFVHIGLFHILLNMISLLFLGSLAEAIYKRTAYLFIYVLSGAVASLASLSAYPITVSAGASGAIFGVCGALIAAFKMGRLQLPPAVVKRELTTLFVFTGLSLLQGAVRPGLNNAAHVGGLAAGSLMGIIVAVAIRRRRDYRRARNFAITLMIVIVVGGYFAVRELRAFTIDMAEGREALASGRFPDARERLEDATRRRPNDAIAFAYLGTAYTRLGDMPRAESAFRRSVELNPRDLTARFQLAVIYYTERKLSDAADTMKQVVAASPNDPQMHEFLAQIRAQQGSAEEAQQEHARAEELLQQNQRR